MNQHLSLGARFKAATRMLFGRYGGGSSGVQVGYSGQGWNIWTGQRGAIDYAEEVGDPTGNGVVSICLGWMRDNFSEPELEVVQKTTRVGDEDKPIEDHPLTQLIAEPNPFYDGDSLWAATLVSYCVDGNAYWIKARGSNGAPLELWHVPFWRMRPCWPDNGREFISHYEYNINGEYIRYRREDVVHFADGMDADTRRGSSRLSAILRDILSDNEAAAYTASILRNMGIPGVLIGPRDVTQSIPDDAARLLEAKYVEKFSGANRGRPLVSSDALDVHSVGFSPEQLALDRIRQIPAARICAALRLHPAVVHLGTDGASSFDNGGQHKAAREAAYEDCLIPLQRRFARTVDRQLLPDLGNPQRQRVQWCYDDVRALSEDEDAASKRTCAEFAGGIATLNEARERRGYDPLPPTDERGEKFSFELKVPALGPDGQPPPESGGDAAAQQQPDRMPRASNLNGGGKPPTLPEPGRR